VDEGSSKSLIARDSCLIKAFDSTGGRRSEVANLRVPDVEKAISSDEKIPMLRLITLKQKEHEQLEVEREIPVYRGTLRAINKYIKRTRLRIIKRINKGRIAKGNKNIIDHDFVFISETTGNPLSADSITTMFNNWANAIGAKGDLIAHAFRHSYITKMMNLIIEKFELKEESELKAKFATDKAFKSQLLSWTGHKSIKSLNTYIHFAFGDLSGVSATMDKAVVLGCVNSAQNGIIELRKKIANGKINASELIDEMDHLLGDLEEVLQA
jgi:integrase